jgi:hypothetical protein
LGDLLALCPVAQEAGIPVRALFEIFGTPSPSQGPNRDLSIVRCCLQSWLQHAHQMDLQVSPVDRSFARVEHLRHEVQQELAHTLDCVRSAEAPRPAMAA